jgi:CheY-like chemotaxis protein
MATHGDDGTAAERAPSEPAEQIWRGQIKAGRQLTGSGPKVVSRPFETVCDMKLPDGTGLDFIARLRAMPTRANKTPCIAITGYQQFFPPSRVGKGFDAYLQKPVDVDELCSLAVALTTATQR